MAAPFLAGLLGWRLNPSAKTKGAWPKAPNTADSASTDSVAIAASVLEQLGVDHDRPDATGSPFEVAVEADLKTGLPALDPARLWHVVRGRRIDEYEQYAHLATLQEAVRKDVTLRTDFGADYLIRPDVGVGVALQVLGGELLHASVSCKWSMRSDRVQNVRREGVLLARHRRGRMPHFVLVTAEPLPSRIASIAQSTGEVDAVYHVAFSEMEVAIGQVANAQQRETWQDLVSQRRVLDYATLAETFVAS